MMTSLGGAPLMPVISRSRHPHEVVLLAIFTVASVGNSLAYSTTASSAIRVLPEPWGLIFYIAVAASGFIALVGIVVPGLTGALIQRAGLLMQAGFLLYFGVAVAVNGTARSITFGVIIAGIGVSHVLRVRQIRKELDGQIHAVAILNSSVDQLEGGGGP
jgi:uncharacterized membrane protein